MKCPRCKVHYSEGMHYNTTLVRIRIKEIKDKEGRVIDERVSRKEYPGKVCNLCALEEGRRAINYTRG
jgi:hypothetical protein